MFVLKYITYFTQLYYVEDSGYSSSRTGSSGFAGYKNPEKTQEEGSIYGSSFGYLSWAYVTEDLYIPAHRKGAMDCYIYVLNQGHLNGDHIDEYSHVLEGDMVIMQSGATNALKLKE